MDLVDKDLYLLFLFMAQIVLGAMIFFRPSFHYLLLSAILFLFSTEKIDDLGKYLLLAPVLLFGYFSSIDKEKVVVRITLIRTFVWVVLSSIAIMVTLNQEILNSFNFKLNDEEIKYLGLIPILLIFITFKKWQHDRSR